MRTERAKDRTVVGIAALAAIYTAVAKLGLGLDAVSGFATLVWPSTGLALVALLRFGFRLWPGIFLGALAVNVWVGAPVGVALGIAAGNTLEAMLGFYAVRRLAGFRGTFDSLRHVLGLVLGAAAVSTLASATLGVLSLSAGGIVRSLHQADETWCAWWVGDVLGDLTVAPLLLSWSGAFDRPPKAKPLRMAEGLALAVALVVAADAVFFRPPEPIRPFASPYVLFPLFVWAALRFELRGASLSTALTSVLAIWGTARGLGPFVAEGQGLARSLLGLQTFTGCAALTTLVVAGAIMDRTSAIRAQQTLLATVSHDLRNPLNALGLSADALLRKLPNDDVRKHHEVLGRAVDRMMRLISDLLDASAVERGQIAVELQRQDVHALANEALELLRPMALAKNLVLQSRSHGSVEAVCDGNRVLQILSNVIGNAIKFSPNDATVSVEVERTERAVLVSVRDGGPGIEAAALPHVFERSWHTASSAGGGSGIGLFIAKGIVEAHGGRIWAKSTVGAGSVFQFTLPTGRNGRRAVLAHRPPSG